MASSTTTRSMLFLAFCGTSFATEDALIMIQHSSSVLTRDVPDPGPDGLLMKRVHSYVEPGGKLEVSFGSQCSELDKGGSRQCSMRWGDMIKGMCKIHVPGGIHSGETIVQGVSMHMRATNPSDPGAAMVPSDIDVVSRCQICGGSCSLKGQTPALRFFLSGPTLIDDKLRCATGLYDASEDFTLFDFSGSMPSLGNLMLDGTTSMMIGLLKADGTKRVEGSYSLKAKAKQSNPAQTPFSLVSFAAKRFANAMTEEQKGALRQAAKLTQRSAPVQQEGPTFVGLDVTIKTVENQDTSLTLTSEKCLSTGSVGSIKCKIPTQSTFDLSAALRLKGNLDEGSMVKIKLKPSVGGVMGNLMNSMLAPIGIEMPLCGQATDIVVMGQTVHVQPPKCGEYELRLESLKSSQFLIPDFVSAELPPVPGMSFMPKTLSELLPLSIELSLDIMHGDMRPMLSAEVALSATQ